MVKVSVQVRGEGSPTTVLVRAASIGRAEALARSRFPGSEVRVIFPIDGDGFFADRSTTEEIEHRIPETIEG